MIPTCLGRLRADTVVKGESFSHGGPVDCNAPATCLISPEVARDLYEILGVKRGAPPDEIKKAYRGLAKRWHPDRNAGNKQAEERFKEVSVAYEVLSDPGKRARDDEFRIEGLAAGFDPDRARTGGRRGRRGGGGESFEFETDGAGFDLNDLFAQMFGGGRGVTFRTSRGADMETFVEVDLPDALRGGEVTLQKEGGRIAVRIPPYIEDGAVLRVAGQGARAPRGGTPGDLHVRVRVRPHASLRREDGVAVLDVPVTVAEAVAGGKIDVPTLGGPVTLTVPPRSQSGTKLRLRGKGGGGRDLIVNLLVQIPAGGGKAAEDAARALDEHYVGDVRRNLRL